MEQNDWVIQIKDIKDTKDKLNKVEMGEEAWKKRFIFKVDPHVAEVNKKAYKPQVVSFGPYHYGEEHLKPMEQHKHRALHHFLKRYDKQFESCVKSLKEVEQDLKDSYDLLHPVWIQDTDAFLQLMVLDGCFMLEILRTNTDSENDYAFNDPIFSKPRMAHMMPFFKCDMLMLENQLPMLVLQKLIAVQVGDIIEGNHILKRLMLDFCRCHRLSRLSSLEECLHLLDVYMKTNVWRGPLKVWLEFQIWDVVKHRNGISRSCGTWEEELRGAIRDGKGTSFEARSKILAWAATVYLFWQEHNTKEVKRIW